MSGPRATSDDGVLAHLPTGGAVALHLGPGPAHDERLTFTELRRIVAERDPSLQPTIASRLVLIDRHPPAEALLDALAALHDGRRTFVANPAWWPREHAAALERLGTAEPDALEAGRLWLATAGSSAEPVPFAFDDAQFHERWFAPLPLIEPGDRVVLTGEVGHAAVLRSALGALACGASVHLTGRAHLAALLAETRVDVLVTTPYLLRRALRQLARRQRSVLGVRRLILHQAPVRPHEHERWPTMLGGTVHEWISQTEAGGWATHDGEVGAGVTLVEGPAGAIAVDGPASARGDTEQDRPAGGWDSGDSLRPVPSGLRLGRWPATGAAHLVRRADRFEVGGEPVDPHVIEACLAADDAVADVVVAPRPHPHLGQVPSALLIPSDPEWPPFLDDLAAALAPLPDRWAPRALAIVEDLPMSAAGTVSRRLVNYEEGGR